MINILSGKNIFIKMDRPTYITGIAYTANILGFITVPLAGKVPIIYNWANLTLKWGKMKEEDLYISSRNVYHRLVESKNLEQKRKANVGIATGEPSGVVVVDVDNEGDTIVRWKKLVEENGVPQTFTVMTPTEGLHYYFLYDETTKNFTNRGVIGGMNIDFRTNGGLVLFPGDFGENEKQYYVIDGYQERKNISPLITIASMPLWIIQLLQK